MAEHSTRLHQRVFGGGGAPVVVAGGKTKGDMAGYLALLPGQTTVRPRRSFYRRIHNGFKLFLMEMVGRPWTGTSTPISIMELGVGRGGDLFKWARLGARLNWFSRLQLWGTDVSDAALQQAWVRIMGSYGQLTAGLDVRLTQADLSNPADAEAKWWRHVPDQSMDVVACHHALHYMYGSAASIDALLRHVMRVLKPGGVFMVTDTRDAELYSLAKGLAPAPSSSGPRVAWPPPGLWVQQGTEPPPGTLPAGTHSAVQLHPEVGRRPRGPGQGYWYALVDGGAEDHYFAAGPSNADETPRVRWSYEYVVDAADLNTRWRAAGGWPVQEFAVGPWWQHLSVGRRRHYVNTARSHVDTSVLTSLHLYTGYLLRKPPLPGLNTWPLTINLPDRVLAAAAQLQAEVEAEARARAQAQAKAKVNASAATAVTTIGDSSSKLAPAAPVLVFKGTMPMTLDVTNVTTLLDLHAENGFQFNMTLKLDGERRWMKWGADGRVWLVNRAHVATPLDVSWPATSGTSALLDVEVMQAADGSGRVWLFVFDLMEYNDRRYYDAPWWQRRAAAEEWFARLSTASVGHVSVQLKQFYHVADLLAPGSQGTVDAILQQHRQYGQDDGWIFTPVYRPYAALPHKWKPLHQQTIDVLLALATAEQVRNLVPPAILLITESPKGQHLMASTGARWCQLLVKVANSGPRAIGLWRHPFLVADVPPEWLAPAPHGHLPGMAPSLCTDAVVELAWDAQVSLWRVHRVRTDRTEPNAVRTVDNVWSLIQTPLLWERIQLEYTLTVQRVQKALDTWMRENQLALSTALWRAVAPPPPGPAEGVRHVEVELRLGTLHPGQGTMPPRWVPGFVEARWQAVVRRWCADATPELLHECVFNGSDNEGRRVQYRLQAPAPEVGGPLATAHAHLTAKTALHPPQQLPAVHGLDVRLSAAAENTLAAGVPFTDAVTAFGQLAQMLGVPEDQIKVFIKKRYSVQGLHWRVDLTQRSSPTTAGFIPQYEIEVEFMPPPGPRDATVLATVAGGGMPAGWRDELLALMSQLLCH